MSALTDFQSQHGATWAGIIAHPAFAAAMQYLNIAKINSIAALTDAEIEANGKLILADLRGHLNHEGDLIRIAAAKEIRFGDVSESYTDPLKELAAEKAAKPSKKK